MPQPIRKCPGIKWPLRDEGLNRRRSRAYARKYSMIIVYECGQCLAVYKRVHGNARVCLHSGLINVSLSLRYTKWLSRIVPVFRSNFLLEFTRYCHLKNVRALKISTCMKYTILYLNKFCPYIYTLSTI